MGRQPSRYTGDDRDESSSSSNSDNEEGKVEEQREREGLVGQEWRCVCRPADH